MFIDVKLCIKSTYYYEFEIGSNVPSFIPDICNLCFLSAIGFLKKKWTKY